MHQQPNQRTANRVNRFFVCPVFFKAQRSIRWATLFVLAALALSGYADAGEATRHYRIPAQSLNNALMRFAAETNLVVAFNADQVRGLTTHGLDGDMTAAQALARLLEGSGLTYRYLNAHSITLEQQPGHFGKTGNVDEKPQPQADNETTLPKITVEADAIYDPDYYADPYNEDYVLPNATAGTKTDTPIMETPLNVQVISKQVLKDQQVINLEQSLKNVSGVNVQSGTGGVLTNNIGFPGLGITLRGFPSTTYLRDGFRLFDGAGQQGMANVENIEVLKGSAAILYGLVEPGGMVNVVTKQPLAQRYYALQQQFGSYDLYRTTLDATGPLTQNDSLLYRVNFSYESSGSFRQFVDNDKVFVAPVVRWNISPKTQLTLEAEYTRNNFVTDTEVVPVYQGQIVRIPRKTNYSEPGLGGLYEKVLGGFNWSHQFNDDWSIKHRFTVAQQSNNSTYMQIASPFLNFLSPTPIPDYYFGRPLNVANYQQNTYATNVDLVGHFNTWQMKHTLLAGGDYYDVDSPATYAASSILALNYINTLDPVHCLQKYCGLTLGPGFLPNSQTSFKQFGIYLQDQIKLAEGLHFTGGLRYQNIDQQFQTSSAGAPFSGPPALQDHKVTPRFGLVWQPKKWVSLYGNYTESFGGNLASLRVYPGKMAPITSAQQLEGGVKFETPDGKLRATFAYFDLTKQNIATADPLHPGFSIVTGEVQSRGPEVDIQGEILPGWNVIGTYANTDITVTKSNDLGYPAQGDRFYGVPRNQGSVWTTYEFQPGNFLKGLKFGGGVTLQSSQKAQLSNYDLPGFAVVDLMAAYNFNLGNYKLSAQLNVNNLLDKYYYNGGAVAGFPTATGWDIASVNFGTPRTFLGSIKLEY